MVRPPDTVRRPMVAIIAVALLFVGFLLDVPVRGFVQAHRTGLSDTAARLGNTFGDGWVVFPGLIGALILAAAARRPAVSDSVARIWRSVVVACVIASTLKSAIGRERPDSAGDHALQFRPLDGRSRFQAFPSGHTTAAFALATSIGLEATSPWMRTGLYLAASLTGFARVNDDRHWFSDVAGGAVLGSAVPLLMAWRRKRRLSASIRSPD